MVVFRYVCYAFPAHLIYFATRAQSIDQLPHLEVGDLEWEGDQIPGKRAFLKGVLRAITPEGGTKTASVGPGARAQDGDDGKAIQKALLQLLDQPVKELVNVEMAKELEARGLAKFFPSAVCLLCIIT